MATTTSNNNNNNNNEYGEDDEMEQLGQRRFFWGAAALLTSSARFLNKWGLVGQDAQYKVIRSIQERRSQLNDLPNIAHSVATIAGVNVRIYRHFDQKQPGPVFIYIHGGGWTIGSSKVGHQFTLELSRDIGATVVSIDYRLAPENPFPAGLDDCLAVTRAILHADDNELTGGLIIDVNRVVIGGDSAGGNLTAAVALDLVRSNDDRRPRGLVLICGSFQAITTSLDSFKRGLYFKYCLEWFVPMYAGVVPSDRLMLLMKHGRHLPEETSRRLMTKCLMVESAAPLDRSEGDDVSGEIPQVLSDLVTNKRAWALLADDSELAQLPATFIQASHDDPIMDDSRILAERMRQAGATDVRYACLHATQHIETVRSRQMHTKMGDLAYDQVVNFVKEIITNKK